MSGLDCGLRRNDGGRGVALDCGPVSEYGSCFRRNDGGAGAMNRAPTKNLPRSACGLLVRELRAEECRAGRLTIGFSPQIGEPAACPVEDQAGSWQRKHDVDNQP